MLQGIATTFVTVAWLTPMAMTASGDDGEEAADKPLAPVVRVLAATTVSEGVSISAELSNPHDEPVTFLGYTSDSFSPPLKEGQISPMYHVQFKRSGEWVEYPFGWCGTGMDFIELKPDAKPTFGVYAAGAEAGWEAVRVGILAFELTDVDEPPPVIWSAAFVNEPPPEEE